MNSQNTNGWPPGSGSGPPPSNSDHASVQQRQSGSFGLNPPMQQISQPQANGPSHIQQSAPFYPSQPNGHALPNPQSLPQTSPMQPSRGPPTIQQHQSPPRIQQHSAQAGGYGLSTLGPISHQQRSPPTVIGTDRDVDRERFREQQMQQDLIAQQQYEQENDLLNHQREQQCEQQRDQQHQSPRENHIGAIPIQQPVASRIPASLHGPNGILNDQHSGSSAQAQASASLGALSGPTNVFANGLQAANEGALRPFPQQATQPVPPQQLLGFSNAVTPQQLPAGVAALSQGLSQGQQPILNDALSYLDQVKVRFVDQPDVYNRFLDIMKDFKSQAIDTPGVIDRVSTLFAGHPELIQGFNTFLPPGYRIECGTIDDPNAIRVTTPMGTTVSQMPAVQNSVQNRLNGGENGTGMENGRQGFYLDGQATGEWQSQQHEADHTLENPFSGGRQGGFGISAGQSRIGDENGLQYDRGEQGGASDAALLAHQQEQRGVSHLVSAATTNGGQGRQAINQVSPGGGHVTIGQAAAGLSNAALTSGNQLGMEKRGPVEFNHAIGYVNKIKNRFATQPEIYKQFLEILQTYQRESKPIQDVYAQVTQLFSSAPDLLEDFKQFLPESAAQAKAQAAAKQATEDAAMLSNVRGDAGYASGVQHAQAQTPRPEMKMPPVGNFAPPSVGKENKKRRGGPGSQMTGGAAAIDASAGPSGQNNRITGRAGGSGSKRARVEQTKPTATDIPPVSPTLVPYLPTPMPPTKDVRGTQDELVFFDRVKKFLANKQTFNEFLKLLNLFSQDLIDKTSLMHKTFGFIGGNTELTTWFKKFIEYDGRDEVIENRPRIPGEKVVLSNCRGLGPSYRLLPKRERLRTCSGRDEMCQQVLNDEWVSHPTWASEDSGFVAHRKNSFEEALHRIEEERHDYDINIEACLRTIQLLEPIAQHLKMMSNVDAANYVLPPGIGGQSETIYQRVIKKIYDREKGCMVIEDMFRRPSAVIPVLLARLKSKVEEWKASQREWDKVWREQTNKIFWKSLDHQGINVKSADKRQFQPKVLHTEIQVRYEEQRRQRQTHWYSVPRYQFKYAFEDDDVTQDACHLILTQLHHAFVGNDIDKSRLETFIKTFIPTFFDLDRDQFDIKMSDIYDATPPNEEVEEDSTADNDVGASRGRRGANGKKSNLLRGVLGRGKPSRKDELVMESKESTPDAQSNDEDTPASTGTPNEQPQVDASQHRWLSHPTGGNANADLNVPFKRENFHLYASLNIYCFFRMFEMLYERLSKIKANEKQVHDDVQRSKIPKPAHELRMIDKKPADFFADVSSTASYYHQIVTMCEDVVKGEMEPSHLEETLRRFYMQNGWQLYSFDKMLAAILRFSLQILISDNKDKSLDIINLFYRDRKEDETTHQAELTYRKAVEKMTKEGDIYRIRWNRPSKTATLQIFNKEDKTYEADELAARAQWSYYVSAFSMFDRTEGVPLSKLSLPFLHRSIPPKLDSEEDYNNAYEPAWNEDGLVIRINSQSYRILYDVHTSDWWVHSTSQQKRGLSAYGDVKESRRKGLEALLGDRKKNAWMKGMSDTEIDKTNVEFGRWIKEGPDAAAAVAGPISEGVKRVGGLEEAGDTDEVMEGT